MAKVNFILFAEESFYQPPPSKDMLVKNPKVVLTPAYVPGEHSFVLVFGLTELKDKGHYTLLMNFKHIESGDSVINDMKFEFDFEKDNSTPLLSKTDATIFNVNMNNMVFEKEGVYEVVMELDGNVKTQEIKVLSARGGKVGES